MDFIEIVKLSFSNLFLNKFRSFLTMLGIIMGIASVILISSLGNGFKNKLISDASGMADKLITVSISRNVLHSVKRNEIFDDTDKETLKNLDNVEYVFNNYQKYIFDEKTDEFSIVNGYGNEQLKAYSIQINSGRYFTQEELNDRYSNVVMLDSNSAERMNKKVGDKIDIRINRKKNTYTIIAIYKNPFEYLTSLTGMQQPYYIMPPLVLSSLESNVHDLYSSLEIIVKDSKKIKDTIDLVTNTLNKKTTKAQLYEVKAASQQVDMFNSIFNRITILISLIASISLIVGGIGVMNIMLVSVTERITEIGLRKALGAKNRDIRNQFLIESIVLTLVGGFIGLVLGFLLATLIGIPLKITPSMSKNVLIVSLSISIITGLFFGYYPAKKASKLSPMEALRKE